MRLAALSNHEIIVPSSDDILAFLEECRQTWLDARSAENDEQLRLARRLIEDLITGKILLYQQGERKQGHGWLQGRVMANIVSVLVKRLTGISLEAGETDQIEVVIDYQKSKLIDEQSETAKRLWDEGLLGVQIAKQMGCIPPYVTKLLQHWFDKRGIPRPNIKSRRIQLENKQTKLPFYKQIANDVHELMGKGHSNLEIARQLKTNDCNVSKAITWWH